MENLSMVSNTTLAQNQSEKSVNRLQQPEWIVAEIVNIISVALVTWAITCMTIYGIRTGKWRRENRRNLRKINAGSVYTSAVVAMVTSYAALLPSQAVFNLGYRDRDARNCELALDVYVLGYTATFISTYVFLWFRQRSLFQHPAMTCCTNKKWLRKLSWGSIVIISIGLLFAGMSYVIPKNYLYSNRGCIAKSKSELTLWPIYAGNGVIVIGQGLMLFLFLYPLRNQSSSGRTEMRILRILKRSAAFAVVCVASDLVAMATLVFFVPENSTRHVTLTVYNFSALANLVSALLSFESWRTILVAPCTRQAERSDTISSQGTYSAAIEPKLRESVA